MTFLKALKNFIESMQAKLEFIYSDEEGAFVSSKVPEYFRAEDIKHIIASSHAPLAERMVRSLKGLDLQTSGRSKRSHLDKSLEGCS